MEVLREELRCSAMRQTEEMVSLGQLHDEEKQGLLRSVAESVERMSALQTRCDGLEAEAGRLSLQRDDLLQERDELAAASSDLQTQLEGALEALEAGREQEARLEAAVDMLTAQKGVAEEEARDLQTALGLADSSQQAAALEQQRIQTDLEEARHEAEVRRALPPDQ